MKETRPYNVEAKAQGRALQLLTTDGVTTKDLVPIRRMQDAGFSVFMHGSGITTGKLGAESDVDFVIIGALGSLPSTISEELTPTLKPHIVDQIDYVSTSQRAGNGRKLSYHLQNPEFRENQPAIPYGREYRSASHLKPSTKNSYAFGAVDREGNHHVISLSCPKKDVEDGVVTHTPQTGTFHIDNDYAVPEDLQDNSFTVFQVGELTTLVRSPLEVVEKPKELVVFGLELTKMAEDVPLDERTTDEAYDQFVVQPLRRSMKLVEDFTGLDPARLLTKGLENVVEIRRRKDGKVRGTEEFFTKYEEKLRRIHTT